MKKIVNDKHKKNVTLKGNKRDGYVLVIVDECAHIHDIAILHEELFMVAEVVDKALKRYR